VGYPHGHHPGPARNDGGQRRAVRLARYGVWIFQPGQRPGHVAGKRSGRTGMGLLRRLIHFLPGSDFLRNRTRGTGLAATPLSRPNLDSGNQRDAPDVAGRNQRASWVVALHLIAIGLIDEHGGIVQACRGHTR
jgi:hypothetical protein